MPMIFMCFLVLFGRRNFIAGNVQLFPIIIKIAVDVPVAFRAYDTQIPFAWIDWEQTAGFQINYTVHTALFLYKVIFEMYGLILYILLKL